MMTIITGTIIDIITKGIAMTVIGTIETATVAGKGTISAGSLSQVTGVNKKDIAL